MRDVQREKPVNAIDIDRVGIRDLRYPIRVLDRDSGERETIGTFTILVDLPSKFRGTHMSRFVELLERYRGRITYSEIEPLLCEAKRFFRANSAYIEVRFPYFVLRRAPSTGAESYLDTEAFFRATMKEDFDFILGVTVPFLLFCPCSQVLTDGKAAHNQRAYATIQVRYPKSEFVWIEELIDIAERCGSSTVRPLLKRADEKATMEHASKNPAFVEDAARSIASLLLADSRIIWFSVEVESLESIHTHNAYAMLERKKL